MTDVTTVPKDSLDDVINASYSWRQTEQGEHYSPLDPDLPSSVINAPLSPTVVFWDDLVHGEDAALWARRGRNALRKRLAEDDHK